MQRLVDEGRITEEEAAAHPQRSLLMRALGSGDHVEPDLSIREVRAGNRYLICSDGLSGVVSHQTMEDTLASYQGPQEPVQNLIELALRGGGPDNITVIVADVLDIDWATPSPSSSPTPRSWSARSPRTSTSTSCTTTAPCRPPRAAPRSRPSRCPDRAVAASSARPAGGDTTGYVSTGGYGDYSDEDFVKPSAGRKWLKRSLYSALALAVIGGGLYGGYRWTQTQYYVRRPGPARRAVPRDQPGPGLGLALEGGEGSPRDRTQVPAGRTSRSRSRRRSRRAASRTPRRRSASSPHGLRVQEGRRAPRRRQPEQHEDRHGPGRWNHGNHNHHSDVQGHVQPVRDAEPIQLGTVFETVHLRRSHSHTRPQPLRRGAEAGLAVVSSKKP